MFSTYHRSIGIQMSTNCIYITHVVWIYLLMKCKAFVSQCSLYKPLFSYYASNFILTHLACNSIVIPFPNHTIHWFQHTMSLYSFASLYFVSMENRSDFEHCRCVIPLQAITEIRNTLWYSNFVENTPLKTHIFGGRGKGGGGIVDPM